MTVTLKLFELVDGKTRSISFSPAVWRAKFVLRHKKVPYDSVLLTFVELPKEIPLICPNVIPPTVPTLVLENNEGLRDSYTIAEYLEVKYPDRPSIFGSPAEKNLQKFFEAYVQNNIHPIIQRLVFQGMYEMQDPENAHYFCSSREKSAGMTSQEISGDRATNMKEIHEKLIIVHGAFKASPGKWLLGDQPGWADFFIAASFAWFNACAPREFEEAVLNGFNDDVFRNFWSNIQQQYVN